MLKKYLDIWVPAAIGIAGLAHLLFVAREDPNPSPFAMRIYMTVLALSAAAFAAMIPGLLRIQVKGPGLVIRAAGALAVFLLVMYYEPISQRLSVAVGLGESGDVSVNADAPKYVPEFSAVIKESNASFDEVKSSFEKELARVRGASSGRNSEAEARLVDHYISERAKYYAAVRVQISQKGSATKGSSGGRKRSPLYVACPADMVFQTGSVAVVKEEGGCYGPSDQTGSSARALVSQTGRGRSACTLVATCQFEAAYIEAALVQERAALTNLTR